MTDLNTDVRYIKGVGESRAKYLSKLGIFTLRDLVAFFPRGYDDRSVIKDISSLIFGESVCVRGVVASEPRLSRIRKGLEEDKSPQYKAVRLWRIAERTALKVQGILDRQELQAVLLEAGENHL